MKPDSLEILKKKEKNGAFRHFFKENHKKKLNKTRPVHVSFRREGRIKGGWELCFLTDPLG